MALVERDAALKKIRAHRGNISGHLSALARKTKTGPATSYKRQLGGALQTYRREHGVKAREEAGAMQSIVDYLDTQISNLSEDHLLQRATFAKGAVLKQINDYGSGLF